MIDAWEPWIARVDVDDMRARARLARQAGADYESWTRLESERRVVPVFAVASVVREVWP